MAVSFAPAIAADVFDDLTRAAAVRAGPANREKTLRKQLLAAAMATGAGHRAAARFGPLALAARARFQFRHLNLDRLAESRLFEREGKVEAKIVAFHGPIPAAALLAEDIAETKYLAEKVAQIHGGRVESAAAHTGEPLVAVGVVSGALLGSDRTP